MQAWHTLSPTSPRLAHIRQEIHWALYPVAAVGATLLPLRNDHSHSSLHWQQTWLMGQEIRPAKAFRTALEFDTLTLHLLGHVGQGGHLVYSPVASFALAGHKLEQIYTWLETAIADYLEHPIERPLRRPEEMGWHLPHHPLEMGAIFSAPNPAFKELRHWFENAAHTLQTLQQEHQAYSGELLFWPAAFELSMSLRFADHSLRVGFCPGDKIESSPYFFVAPWPVPAHAPRIYALGRWNESQWSGVLLPAEEVLHEAPDAITQQARVLAFLRDAIARLR
jgi:hypothetical protein